jgi:hypothetical protein
MSKILPLSLHREFFAAIANKQKRIEYRKQSLYFALGSFASDVLSSHVGFTPTPDVSLRGSEPTLRATFRH